MGENIFADLFPRGRGGSIGMPETRLYRVFAEKLREKGFCSKTGIVDSTPECGLLVCSKGEDVYLVAIAAYGEWLYARITPEYGLPPDKWYCSHVYYTPYGLYVFEKSLEQLVSRLMGKERRVKAIARLAYERATGL